MVEKRRVVIICSNEVAELVATGDGPRDVEAEGYAGEVAGSLAALGHRVEVWTARCPDESEAERLGSGVLIRRFRGRCDYVAPRVRPCGWVSEFVAHAADRLADEPTVASTLVTHNWEAGVAGRALARRFRLAQVHVPHALTGGGAEHEGRDGTGTDPGCAEIRRMEEERETCREAWRVVATSARHRESLIAEPLHVPMDRVVVVPPGHGIGQRFAAALGLPPAGAARPRLAAAGDAGRPSTHTPFQRRGPWEVADVDQPARRGLSHSFE